MFFFFLYGARYDARRSRENYRQQQRQHETSQQRERSPLGVDSVATPAPRVHFQFDGQPALLLLKNVADADEGVYRCRVDFGRSPTRNVLVQLSVVGERRATCPVTGLVLANQTGRVAALSSRGVAAARKHRRVSIISSDCPRHVSPDRKSIQQQRARFFFKPKRQRCPDSTQHFQANKRTSSQARYCK